MRVGRIVASVASALALAGLGIAGATPASAVRYTCSTINGLSEVRTNGSPSFLVYSNSVDFAAGDILTATWSAITGTPSGVQLQIPADHQVAFSETSTATLTYTFNADAPAQGIYARLQGSVTNATITITCTGPSSGTSSGPAIPEWVQAFGIFHRDDACLTGWTNSWQHWAEPITGGWVCTRTIPSLG
jgi:hypothetical protein